MLDTARKQVRPAGCGCGTSAKQPKPLVYVVGSIGFDFGTEARRDALYAANGGTPILTGMQLANFLEPPPPATPPYPNAPEAASIIWTLSDDQYPLYAIRPLHPYGALAYHTLTGFLRNGVDRISVPGWMNGQVRLLNGWVVPVIEPDVQGLRAWSTANVVQQIASGGGTITVSNPIAVAIPSVTNLTALGTADWAYWGNSAGGSFDHSASSDGEIVNLTAAGTTQTAGVPSYTFTWTNGTPTTSATATKASQFTTVGSGFKFTVPADTNARVLTVWVSVTNCTGTLVATLSDGSAMPVSVATVGNGQFMFTINYQGVSAGTLNVAWTMTSATTSPSLVLQAATLALGASTAPSEDNASDLQNFMNRIYFELRNPGVSPQERASNFAATQAYFVNNVITYAVGHGLNLQTVSVSHSPLCRPGSECWDVNLTFFDPQNVTNTAHKTFRFTIDVSDVKPVMIGPMYQFNSF